MELEVELEEELELEEEPLPLGSCGNSLDPLLAASFKFCFFGNPHAHPSCCLNALVSKKPALLLTPGSKISVLNLLRLERPLE